MTKKLPKAVRPEEFKRLIRAIPDKDKISKVSFLLAYGSGLRVSEIVGGKRDEDKQNILPLTSENIKENSIEILNAKSGRDRVVPIPKGWKKWMEEILPIKKSIRTLQRNFKEYSGKIGLPDYYTFHSLRHGFATRLIESGVPINHVQTLLGHSNISTTNVYTRARPQEALKSYEDLF